MLRLLLIVSAWLCGSVPLCAAAGAVFRQAPSQALPGVVFPLTNQTSFSNVVSVHAVEEEFPVGWTAASISHGGRFDPGTRKVKWGPFFDATPRALSCFVTPAASAGVVAFIGKASFDGLDFGIGGVGSIRILSVTEANSATAVLPELYSPGVPLEFKIVVQPAANLFGYAVEDSLPTGWTANAFNEGGTVSGGKLRWGPFFDATPRELRCSLMPPVGVSADVIFSGVASFDGAEIPIGGARVIHPLLSRLARTAPLFYQAGGLVVIQVAVTPAPGVSVYSISESIPTNWIADTISNSGVFDTVNRAVKWGPFFDNVARTFSFVARIPNDAAAPGALAGQGAFDNQTILATGPAFIFPATGSSFRVLPDRIGVGENLSLSNIVTPKPGSVSWAAQDQIPNGWTVFTISDGGVFDSAARLVKWGPFFDDAPRMLTAQIVSSFIAGPTQFQGIVSFDGIASAISGPNAITVEAPPAAVSVILRDLPATLRPGSGFILSNVVNPADFISIYAVEERVPAGWSAVEISDGGVFDTQNRAIKWGPFFDHTERLLTCRIISSLGATGVVTFTGHGSFDGLDVLNSGDATLIMAPSSNRAPVAVNDTFVRPFDRVLTFPASRLLLNDTDTDNDALRVISVTTSSNGFPVTLVAGTLTYGPPAGNNLLDTFRYTVEDVDGATATATVTISPAPAGSSQNIISIEIRPDGAFVRFGGIPTFAYDIQTATTLQPPNWTIAIRRTADFAGRFEFLDTGALTVPQRFYRTLFVE